MVEDGPLARPQPRHHRRAQGLARNGTNTKKDFYESDSNSLEMGLARTRMHWH